MRKIRTGHPIVLALASLLVGLGLGLGYGWIIDPVEYVDTEIAALHPAYQDDLVLMVSQAYASDQNLDIARARIALLNPSSPEAVVADLAERVIVEGRPEDQIRVVVQLAAAMGVQREAFRPYQSVEDGQR